MSEPACEDFIFSLAWRIIIKEADKYYIKTKEFKKEIYNCPFCRESLTCKHENVRNGVVFVSNRGQRSYFIKICDDCGERIQ